MQNSKGYSQYKPYNEDSDSSDSETDSDYLTDDEIENFTSTTVQLPVPPNPADLYRKTVINTQEFDKYAIQSSSDRQIATFDMSGVSKDATFNQINNTTLSVQTRAQTTTIMVTSDDRDRRAFPQPTQVTLHLPRLYRNVTSIDITQIKLLTSFLYFRDAKYNTFFNVYEQERIKVNDSSQNNIIQVKIREGSYNIDTLLSELTKQMNKTPIFFDYPNGFDDFSRIFPTNGDLGINFNQPGDFFYDSLIDKFIEAPNINYIVTRYFQSRYAGLVNYSIKQILNAYYYPVLKEAFLDPVAILSINTDVSSAVGMPISEIYKDVIFGFKGLDDVLTYDLIKLNQAFLDDYRQRNTFHYSLVNKYDWSYDRFNNRITVSSSNLNTSIIRYITNITNQYSNDALKDISYTPQQYTSLVTQRNQSAAVITDMYNYFQSILASNFAVNFGSYSLQQLADPSHIIYVQNAQDVSGVFTQYSIDYFNATADGRIKIPPNFSDKPAPLNPKWKLDTLSSVYNTADFNMGIKNNPYDFTLSNQIITNTFFVDPNTYLINAANLSQTNNIVVNIPSTKYAIFKFRSDTRQTIQIETLSKPLFFRYPEYNSNFGGAIPYFYNTPYSFNDISAADVSDISINTIPTVFGASEITATSISNILTTTPLSITRANSIQFYTFTAPDTSGIILLPDSSGSIYTLNIHVASTLSAFNSPITAFIYHDRSAFMADANNIRSESQLNYIYTATSTIDASTITIPLRVYSGDKYYIILRSVEQSIPDIPYSIKIYWLTTEVTQLIKNFEGDVLQTESFAFQDPKLYLERYQNDASMNYYIARTYDPAFIRLPLSDASGINVGTVNPSDDIFALTFPPGATPIGYDSSGVSNDLTDYIVFNPITKDIIYGIPNTGTLLQDPHTEYIFQYFSPYSIANTSYFYPTSINFLSLPNTSSRLPYTYGTAPAKREYKIVHYHDTHFFAPHSAEIPTDITDISSQIVMTNRNVYDDLSGADLSASYDYSIDTVFNKNVIQLGQGICGITFVPPEGWWDVASFTFKSANYKHTSENPNELIEYIGVYPLRAVSGKNSVTIVLEDSLILLKIHDSHHYAPGGPNPTVDPKYGSYYVFNRVNISDNIINYSRPDIVNQGFAGYTPYPGKLINSEDDLYTLIAFDASKNIMPFHMLAGSLIPRPDISVNFTVSSTYNGYTAPTNTVMITPSGSPYESQYQQSLPIGTQVLNYFQLADLFKDSEGFYKYDVGLLTGDLEFRLRSTAYINAGNYYFITGNISGDDLRGDVYKVINPGSEPRSSVYINQFNLSGFSINHKLVWWTSTTTTAYAVTKDLSSTTCEIYTFNPLLSNPSVVLDMSFSAVDSSGNSFDLSSTTKHRFYFTNNGSFLLYGTVNNGTTQSVMFYNKPTSISSSFVGSLTETIVDAHVHCQETLQYHILTNISGQKTLYDISQGISTPIPIKTRISPLFGEGLYSMRVNSYGTPYFLTTDYNNRYASITSREPLDISSTGYNLDARMEVNAQSLPYEISPLKTEWQIGTSNSIFIQTQISTVITEPPWGIVGNTQLNGDRKYGIYNAWQVFYPVMKIILNKRANIYNSLVNIIDINQPVTEKVIPESYRTNMFFYKDYTTLLSDLCGSSGWKWGMESNYTAADQAFSGYEFNSYIYNINVQPSPPVPTISDDFYYIAIRGYTPSEDFQTLVRWRLPNRYDFGQIALNTIISEISDSIINSSNYNPNYSKQLSTFNTSFNITKTFGANSLSNFPGSNYTFTGFSNFHSTFASIYNTYSTASATISYVNTHITSNVLSNMQTYFKNILPDSYFERTNLGSSIPYDLLFKSSIPNIGSLQTLDQEWGIGWNLGFGKKDYTDNTVYTAPSFFKILDDYIYLRINEEFQGMNNIDSTGKENLNETHESRGAINQYNGKLLLSAFGNYSQTMIKNPIYFNPPIGKLDRLKFTWMDSKGQVIDNIDCDWSLAVNITENVERATAGSSLIQGKV